jgi:hypothetical protein
MLLCQCFGCGHVRLVCGAAAADDGAKAVAMAVSATNRSGPFDLLLFVPSTLPDNPLLQPLLTPTTNCTRDVHSNAMLPMGLTLTLTLTLTLILT